MAAPDVLALEWPRAKARLEAAGCRYETEITRSTRDYFQTDPDRLHVVRQRELPDGTISLTLAARLVSNIHYESLLGE